MKSIIVIFLIFFGFCSAAPAQAAKWMVGKDETTHKIQDIELQGAEGEALYLSYKTTSYFLGAGIFMKDDGYVLGVVGEKGSFYPFPAVDEVKNFQELDLLPNPLPNYEIPLINWLVGFSLWIILAVIGGYYGIRHFLKH